MDTHPPSTARDTFLYLLVVVTLAMSTVALGALVFDLINRYLPDTALAICAYDGCVSSMRGELSVLLIAFAVLVWCWRFLQHDVAANPERAQFRVRKWLLYFTLFVAGCVLIGDLISLLYNWLGGDLTRQFTLKVLTVLVIASATFKYFLGELHPEKPHHSALIGWGSIAVVLVALISGFIAIGSPGAARDIRLDSQRISDLQNIQSQIVMVWQTKGVLPNTLNDLRDPISGFMPPTDPETTQPYEYIRTSATEFMLCAVFSTSSQGQVVGGVVTKPIYGPYGGTTDTWDHAAGRVCFDRPIDVQRYPVLKK